MFVILFFVAAIFIALIVFLPYASGLATYQIEKKSGKKPTKSTQNQQDSNNYYDYIPPDEQIRNQKEEDHSLKARASAIKEKLQVTSDDIPVRIKLQQDGASLRKRTKEKLDVDTNPNNYDYDLDELIKEEAENAIQVQEKEFYKDVEFGKDKEEMV